MGYMSFEQQTVKHLQFLQEAGLEVASLIIDSPEFIRSRTTGKLGRGEYAYKTFSMILNNGLMGLTTWCRSKNGEINTCKTYGWPRIPTDNKECVSDIPSQIVHQPITRGSVALDTDLEKIRKFWKLSSRSGISDYLIRKGVGSYRIRFRENQYGKVAIVPIVNICDKLCGYQMLNSNGSKCFKRYAINGEISPT